MSAIDELKEELKTKIESLKKEMMETTIGIAYLKNLIETNHKSTRETSDRVNSILEKHDIILHGKDGSNGLNSKIGKHETKLAGHIFMDKWAHGIFITLILALAAAILKH